MKFLNAWCYAKWHGKCSPFQFHSCQSMSQYIVGCLSYRDGECVACLPYCVYQLSELLPRDRHEFQVISHPHVLSCRQVTQLVLRQPMSHINLLFGVIFCTVTLLALPHLLCMCRNLATQLMRGIVSTASQSSLTQRSEQGDPASVQSLFHSDCLLMVTK